MPSSLPDGDPAPTDGSLPTGALDELLGQPLSVYVHVPFCRTRCGYCDFNTYTAEELGPLPGASRGTYVDAALAEVRRAVRVLDGRHGGVPTVFLGGGTPTLLPVADLARLLAGVRDGLGLDVGAEVTTEANPDSVDSVYLRQLREAGYTRVSFGMQSAVPHVLAALERTHDPERVPQVVAWAREAGLDVSLDLIYGTPGEGAQDWQASLDAVVAAAPDHVSAYALIVEDGTRLAVQVRRGQVPMPDDDDLADKYLQAEEALSGAGLRWYEVSNWSTGPRHACRHNLAYWRSEAWWGIGPGAHSHIGGVRWWNVTHPAAYSRRLAQGASPAQAREVLVAEDRRVERILLGIRVADGVGLDELQPAGLAAARRHGEGGLLDTAALAAGRAVLTLRGRLLADAVVRDLVD